MCLRVTEYISCAVHQEQDRNEAQVGKQHIYKTLQKSTGEALKPLFRMNYVFVLTSLGVVAKNRTNMRDVAFIKFVGMELPRFYT